MKRGRPDHDNQPPPKKLNAGPKVKDAMGYLEKVKNKFANKPQVYNQFLDIMKDFKSQTINTEGVIERVKTLFKGNRHLILGFNQFLPPGYKIELPPPSEKKTTIEFNHAVQYVAKIKNRFRDQPEIYGEFLDILHDYQANRTIDEVFMRVQKLFGGQPDLLDEFKYFLPAKQAPSQMRRNKNKNNKKKPMLSLRRTIKDDSQRMRVRVSYPPGSEKDLQLLERIKQTIPRKNWIELVKVLHLHTLGIVTRLELVTMVEDVMGSDSPEYVDRFKHMIGYDEWEESQRITRERKNYYTFVASVDFTSCQQPTPSYRRIPDDIPLPSCSGRTPLCDEVLNNRCISIPTGSEDFSFKSTRKNQYEENLFKCEDERFELDMVIENNAAAIRILEPLEQKIEEMTPEQAKAFALPDDLDILHIRAIARVYGDHGYQIIDLLRKNPSVAIPIVLARLRQKDEEWRRVRVSMRDSWRKIAAQNYNKSLDHRSFYFKQEDKKRINPKSLITNLKDMHNYIFSGGSTQTNSKSNKPDNDFVRQIQQGNGPLFNYCMRFKYPDPSIHEEVYRTIKFALPYHPEINAERALEFWKQFIHHFFNAPAFDEDGKVKSADAEESKENGMEIEGDKSEAKKAEDGAKPVRLSLDTWEMDERVMPIRRHLRKSRLFFGTNSLYVLLRLHELLYSRLHRAKELAYTHKNKATKAQLDAYAKSNKRRKDTPKPVDEEENDHHIDDLFNGTGESKARKTSKEPLHPYEQFRSLLKKLLSKQMDTTHFEDELRALLGAKSFVIFTVDKLVTSLLKQIHSVSSSEVCNKLVGLYHSAHDWTRSYLQKADPATKSSEDNKRLEKIKLRRSAQAAKMYQEMCTSEINEELCCQMEYFEDTKELAIGLLDSNESQHKSTPSEFQEYVKSFMKESGSGTKRTPFLGRNVRSSLKKYGDVPMSQALVEANKGVEQFCGLEFRMNMRNYKLQFVDDTEEYFLRRRKTDESQKKRLDSLYEASKKAFRTWEESRLETAN
mmetsp:Transcript_21997/g.42715  ORF Transcript_21997/g.42715 Transcript_21997/m.42715 type:complete len:1011 (+) Transcript_21997:60-3092(+)